MLKKVYYFTIQDLEDSYIPFEKYTLSTFLISAFDLDNLTGVQVPADFTTNASIYNELYSLVLGRYMNEGICRIVLPFNLDPTDEDIAKGVKDFAWRFLSLLNQTYEYYMTLLLNYSNAKADLMADIKATSTNKVAFNDTPQNPNSSNVYEGDDYITHFTKTSGETSSPLMSKIMRLKEIQENYHATMSEWVNKFERIFYEVG